MSFAVYSSQKIDRLYGALATFLEAYQQGDESIFCAPMLVLPTYQGQNEFRVQLAEQSGIVARLHIEAFEGFFQSLIEGFLESDVALLNKHVLCSALLQQMPEIPKSAQELRAKVDEALALSSLWSHYAVMRPQLMRDWQNDAQKLHPQDFEPQSEQQHSVRYAALFKSGALHTGQALWKHYFDILGSASFKEHLKALPKQQYIFFDPCPVSTLLSEVLHLLAQYHDVFVFVYNPCMELWEDLRRPKVVQSIGSPNNAIWEDDACYPLQQWGSVSQCTLKTLFELSEAQRALGSHTIFATLDRELELAPCPLGRLQEAILRFEEGLLQGAQEAPGKDGSEEHSIVCLRFDSIEEEVFWVGNDILAHMQKDPSLQFRDFCLYLPPPQLELYASSIVYAFNQKNAIAYNPDDLAVAQISFCHTAFAYFLELFASNLSREAVLKFITHPLVLQSVGPDMGAQWIAWAEQLGVFYGESESKFDATESYEQSSFHWEQALNRLYARCFHALDAEHEVLSGARDIQSATLFIHYVRACIGDIRYTQEHEHTFGQWARLLERFIDCYFQPESTGDKADLGALYAIIKGLYGMDLGNSKLYPFALIREILLAKMARHDNKRQSMPIGVGLKALTGTQYASYRYVYLCGLDKDSTAQGARASLDIRKSLTYRGESTAYDDEAGAFLKAVLNAGQAVALTCSKRSANGEDVEPSPFWEQFVDYYQKRVKLSLDTDLETKAYYLPRAQSEILRSFALFKGFGQFGARVERPRGVGDMSLDSVDAGTRLLSDFLVEPNSAYKRHILGQRHKKSMEEQRDESIEPFTQSDDKLLQGILTRALLQGQSGVENYRRSLQTAASILRAQGRYPDSYFSQIQENISLKILSVWEEQLRALSEIPARFELCQLGQGSWWYRRYGLFFEPTQSRSLSSSALRIDDELPIYNREAAYCFFPSPSPANSNPASFTRDRLRVCILGLCLVASVPNPPPKIYALYLDESVCIALDKIEQTQAQHYLQALLQDIMSAQHELVVKCYENTKPSTSDELLELAQSLLDDRAQCSPKLSLSPVASLQAHASFVHESLEYFQQCARQRYDLPNSMLESIG